MTHDIWHDLDNLPKKSYFHKGDFTTGQLFFDLLIGLVLWPIATIVAIILILLTWGTLLLTLIILVRVIWG